MDRIGDLRLFLRVLDSGSITAAAHSLNLSVAVVSLRLKRLEREMGVRLLHRTTRRLSPTVEGTALAQRGRALADEFEALTQGLRSSGTGVAGTLRITTASMFGQLYISPLVPKFLARHPQVSLSVNLSDEILDLVGAGFDLAIRIGALDDSSLVARKLAVNRRVLCASPEYLRLHGTPRTPNDLEKHQCLVLVGSQGRRDIWHLTDRKKSTVAVRIKGRIESNQGELLHDATTAGLGISMHSTWHVWDDLRTGRLQVVLPDYPLPDTGIYAVTPQRRMVPPRVRAFVEFLVQHFENGPPWNDPQPREPRGKS
ncbi:MAG TPA: LysR family transcriptional regulator [Steroidobacteraceae bacterium]|nr:LysR family transcriptional regulator [Steroidobacteraceae bacterium]